LRRAVSILAVLLCVRGASAASARLTVEPVKAHVGDALKARLTVTLGPGETVDVQSLPVEWGPAQILSGAWEPAVAGVTTRVWSGSLAVYQLGTVTVPPVSVSIVQGGASSSVATEPVALEIEGTLPQDDKAGEKAPDLMDLKPPASIPPDYGPLKVALVAFIALLAAALAAFWLWRRYAARLAAVAAPVDPFRKLPPHVWVYEELEKLLARRLAEEGRIGLFYDELTRIVKQYLEGRYRVDLLERTTSEVPGALQHAGAPVEAGTLARALLESGDRVKFARVDAGPSDCRAAVEEAYRLVDLTKPVEAELAAPAVEAAR
jgi:hypothetical protein